MNSFQGYEYFDTDEYQENDINENMNIFVYNKLYQYIQIFVTLW